MGSALIPGRSVIRCCAAKAIGLKARVLTTKWERLANTLLHGIATLRDGSFLLVGRASEDKIIVQAPYSPRPNLMTRTEFEVRMQWQARPDDADSTSPGF